MKSIYTFLLCLLVTFTQAQALFEKRMFRMGVNFVETTAPLSGTTEKSLGEALKALKDVGLPWLAQLKDAVFFADAVDKQIFDLYGAALEEAGRFEESRVQYLRQIEIFERCRDLPKLPKAMRMEDQESIDALNRRIASLPKE